MNDNNKEIENSINSKELTSQNHSIEPQITIFKPKSPHLTPFKCAFIDN